MKRRITVALSSAVLLLCVVSPVLANPIDELTNLEPAVYGNGWIQTGHPVSTVIGVTEAEFKVRHCPATIASQGFDGLVLPVAQYFAVRGTVLGLLEVPSTMSFYSAGCRWVATKYYRNDDPVSTPLGSAWVVVSFPQGTRIFVEWKTGPTYGTCTL